MGEAIMLNHAPVASLRLTGATLITDDGFHRKAMTYELEQALKHPRARSLIDSDRIRSDLLALAALTDTELELPAMAPEIPLEKVLEYRDQHALAGRNTYADGHRDCAIGGQGSSPP